MSATIPALSLLALLSSAPTQAGKQAIPATVRTGLKVAVVDERGASVEGRVEEVTAQDHRRTLYERGARPQARLRPLIGRQLRRLAATIQW